MKNIEHYFDWAATSPEDAEILREALEISLENDGNPSSVHAEGRRAKNILEEARSLCAKTLGVPSETVFFTSGGTESDHIALLSVMNKNSCERGEIIVSGIEHPAMAEECAVLEKQGFTVIRINPDVNGFVSADAVAEKLTKNTQLVSVMAVNNETGCIQDIYGIADKITEFAGGKKRPHFHVDFVQAAGKIPVCLNYRGIDSGAFSAHKISGPRGIGILYLAREIVPFLKGGGQENGIRSGTENLFGAAAFSKCLEKYFISAKSPLESGNTTEKSAPYKRFLLQREYTKNFIEEILKIPGAQTVPLCRKDINLEEKFSPWVLQCAFKNIPGNVMVRALDAKGFCISTGSACSSRKQKRPVLAVMNISREIQDTAVRFSFGPATTKAGMEDLANAVKEICEMMNG